MRRIAVYEHLVALADAGLMPASAASLYEEGWIMRQAVLDDLARLANVVPIPTTDPNEPADLTIIIAPETEGILAQLVGEARDRGRIVIAPTLDAIRLTSDKRALAQHLSACGVPTPPTVLLADRQLVPSPWVVKPIDGAGSLATYLVQDESAAEEIPKEEQTNFRLIAQPFVPGFAASMAFLVGPMQCVPLCPCAQRLSKDGRFTYLGGELPLAPELADRVRTIASQAVRAVSGLSGFIGIDVVLADQGPDMVIEINPRFSTSFAGLRAATEVNLIELMLRVTAGEEVTEPQWTRRVVFTPGGQVVVSRTSGEHSKEQAYA